MMRIAIMGGRGLLGTDLCGVLTPEHTIGCLDLPECDITRPEALDAALRAFGPDAVVNCAAYTKVDAAESEPTEAFAVNDQGAGNVAAACRALGAYLIHLSTDYVFDGDAQAPYPTTAPTAPLSVYGRSKRAGELRVMAELPDALIVRSCGLYGLAGPSFVASVLTRALEGEPLRIVDDQTIGAPTYTVDLAGALCELLAERPRGIRHIVNEGVCTWYQFGLAALAAAGLREYPVEPISTAAMTRPAPRPRYSALAPSPPYLRHYTEALAGFVPRWLHSREAT